MTAPPSPPIPPTILREERDWLILAKPPGWHSAAPGKRAAADRGDAAAPPDIETWLRSMHPWARDLPEGGLVHRLDFETSGCLLVATSAGALDRLRAQVRGEAIAKTYLALVRPGLAAIGDFSLFFSTRRTRSPKVTVRERGESRELGRCAWRDVGRAAGSQAIEVRIIGPGRRHQIRAGLARLGHPLLGDTLYGGAPWEGGLALHAAQLTVEGTVISCPPPSTWPVIETMERPAAARSAPAAPTSSRRGTTRHVR